MKLFLYTDSMKHKAAIEELLNHEAMYNPNLNGMEYTIEQSDFTYIDEIDEQSGDLLITKIFQLIEALEHGEYEAD